MKLVLLSTNMARGGAETQVAHLAIRLRRRGWDVDVVSLLKPTAYAAELADAGVPLHARSLVRLPSLLRRLRPQILHCHMFHANLAGRLLRVVMPFPVVISTLHSAAESKRATGAFRHRDLMYRVTDRLCDMTVAVSAAVAERHLTAGATRRMEVIPNGVDTDVYCPNDVVRERLRRELGAGDAFVWLAAGRLMWKKNYPLMLRAFAELGSGQLWIAGAGPDQAALRQMAGSNVRFLGERKDVADLMRAADGFVLTSKVEGLPLALLEAAATGLPCVATDAGGVREVGVGSVVDESEIPRAMQMVMSMAPADRAALGAAARRRVVECYSLDAVVAEWEALYRRLAPWT